MTAYFCILVAFDDDETDEVAAVVKDGTRIVINAAPRDMS